MTQAGIEPWFPGPLVNTLLTREDKVLQIYCNLGELIQERVSGQQSSLNFCSFCGFMEVVVFFQLLFNFS